MDCSKSVRQKVKELKKLRCKVQTLNPYEDSFQSGLEDDFLLNGLLNKMNCYQCGLKTLDIPQKDLEMAREVCATVKNVLQKMKCLAVEVASNAFDDNAIGQKNQQYDSLWDSMDNLINNHPDLYNVESLVNSVSDKAVALPCTVYESANSLFTPQYSFTYSGRNLTFQTSGTEGLIIREAFYNPNQTDATQPDHISKAVSNAAEASNQIDEAIILVNDAALYFESKTKVLRGYVQAYGNIIKLLEGGVEKWKDDKCEFIDSQLSALEYDC